MKAAINSLVLLFMCLSCNAPDSNPTANIARAKQMFEAFNRHEWEAMANAYADQASFLDPSFGSEYVIKSKNETVTKYAEMEKMFADIHDEIIDIYPSDNKVIVEFISTGTAEDGSKFKLPIISVLTFKDGLIVKDATYYDNP